MIKEDPDAVRALDDFYHAATEDQEPPIETLSSPPPAQHRETVDELQESSDGRDWALSISATRTAVLTYHTVCCMVCDVSLAYSSPGTSWEHFKIAHLPNMPTPETKAHSQVRYKAVQDLVKKWTVACMVQLGRQELGDIEALKLKDLQAITNSSPPYAQTSYKDTSRTLRPLQAHHKRNYEYREHLPARFS